MRPTPPLLTPRDRADFTVAIICALGLEADAVLDTFDVVWDDDGYRYGRASHDKNIYTAGVVGGHNVILVHMSGMGVTSASIVAANLHHSFPNITLALVVGVCGGVPHSQHHANDIFLGDLVVSTAVVQYDFGRQYPTTLERKDTMEDSLGRPSHEIRAFLAKLKTRHYSHKMGDRMLTYLDHAHAKRSDQQYPGQDQDVLYEPGYLHKHQPTKDEDVRCAECTAHPDQICEVAKRTVCQELGCSTGRQVHRQRCRDDGGTISVNSAPRPAIHFGRIGSGNTVIKSGQHRDQISERDSVIAFEMEGAGIWDYIPSIVVKGVCDYADSHKSKAWQHYAATVAAAGAAAMLQEWEPNQPSQGPGAYVPSGSDQTGQRKACRWHLPFVRDPDFVPRDDVMQQIHKLFQNTEYSPCVVLTGMGGVGKSQIAIEYAYQVREHTTDVSVFWIYASTPARFRASFQNLARELELPGSDDPAVDQVERVYQWLQSERDSGRWLLILDNVDDINLLSSGRGVDDANLSIIRYLPQRAGGTTLVTSRDSRVAVKLASRPEHTILVPIMSQSEADTLLRRKIPSDQGRDTERATLLESLDYLPLAITQTAAYITRRQRMTVTKYVEIFTGHALNQIRLLTEEETDLRRSWDVPHSVVRTWEISFTQIQSQNSLATELLSLMAVFDRHAVPDFLLQMDHDVIEFEDAIEVLLGYAFIQMETNGSVFKAHRLVQLATRAWLSRENRWNLYQKQALVLLDKHYPTGDYENWAKCQVLEPHAEHALRVEYHTDDVEVHQANILYKRARYLMRQGNYKQAHIFAHESFQKRTAKLGAMYPATLGSLSLLADILSRQGQYSAAEQMCRQVLSATEMALGPEHPDTLTSMHNLAAILSIRGQHRAAEQISRQTLVTMERVLGLEHHRTLAGMNTLANIFNDQRRYAASEQICRQTLSTIERLFGPEHPETLKSRHNLALALKNQGHYEAAEQMFRPTITTMEKVLGLEHPDTLTSMHNLALVLGGQERYVAAEQIFRQVLLAREKVLGLQHPVTLATVWRLAQLLSYTQSDHEAYRFYDRACTGVTSALGGDHPRTQLWLQEFNSFKRGTLNRVSQPSHGGQSSHTS